MGYKRKQRIVRRYPARAILDKYPDLTMKQVAEKFGIGYDTIQRWNMDEWMLSEWQADEVAVRAGLHPCQIWVNWFDIPLTKDTWRHSEVSVGV